MTLIEFKNTFVNGKSNLMPDGKNNIIITGHYRNITIDYDNSSVHKWTCNYGLLGKKYKSYMSAIKKIFKELDIENRYDIKIGSTNMTGGGEMQTLEKEGQK